MGVIVTRANEIVICDSGNGQVLAIDALGATRTLASGLDRPTGIAEAADGGVFVSEAGAGTLRHISHLHDSIILSGLDEPHGVAVVGDTALVLDRGTGTLHRAASGQRGEVLARGLPSGAHGGVTPNVLPGIKDLMPGPLLPFSDIAVLGDGRIAIGGDENGSILLLAPDD